MDYNFTTNKYLIEDARTEAIVSSAERRGWRIDIDALGDTSFTSPLLLIIGRPRIIAAALDEMPDSLASLRLCYQRTVDRISSDPFLNAAYLAFEARRLGLDATADDIESLGLPIPFATDIAQCHAWSTTTVLYGHRGRVSALAWGDIDGTPVLATGSWDTTVRLWNPSIAQQIREPLVGHTDIVEDIEWSSYEGNPIIGSASRDATARIWQARNGEQIRVFQPFGSSWITGLAFVNIGSEKAVALTSHDGQLAVIDIESGMPRYDPIRIGSGWAKVHAFDVADVTLLATTCSDDQQVRLFVLETGAAAKVPSPFDGLRFGYQIGAWGKLADRPALAAIGEDDTIRVWLVGNAEVGSPFDDHEAVRPRCVAWLTKGQRDLIAGAFAEGTGCLWDASTGQIISRTLSLAHGSGAITRISPGRIKERTVLAVNDDSTVRLCEPYAQDHRNYGTEDVTYLGNATAAAWETADKARVLALGNANGEVWIVDTALEQWNPRLLGRHDGSVEMMKWLGVGTQRCIVSSHWPGGDLCILGREGKVIISTTTDPADSIVGLEAITPAKDLTFVYATRKRVHRVKFDSSARRLVPVLPSPFELPGEPGVDRISCIAALNRHIVAVGTSVGKILIVGGLSFRTILEFETRHGFISGLAWANVNGEVAIISAGSDGVVCAWKLDGSWIENIAEHGDRIVSLTAGMLCGHKAIVSGSVDMLCVSVLNERIISWTFRDLRTVALAGERLAIIQGDGFSVIRPYLGLLESEQ